WTATLTVEARVVEDAAGRAPLAGWGCPQCRQPLGSAGAPPRRVDDEGSRNALAFLQQDARHRRPGAVDRRPDEAGHPGPFVELDPGPIHDARAEGPFESRPTAGEQHDILIVGALCDDPSGRCAL